MKSEADIIALIQSDKWMMDILQAARSLNLPDWWICAGFIRSKIWDTLHEFSERTEIPDIDLIYFDPVNMYKEVEKGLERQLKEMSPDIPWSVKNEARMHLLHNNIFPYESATDAIAKFPETATALGVKLGEDDVLTLFAPHGLEDVLECKIRPTEFFKNNQMCLEVYKKRIATKNWHLIWNKINYS